MSPYFLENQATDTTSFRKFVAKFKKKRKIVYFRRISAFSSKKLNFLFPWNYIFGTRISSNLRITKCNEFSDQLNKNHTI